MFTGFRGDRPSISRNFPSGRYRTQLRIPLPLSQSFAVQKGACLVGTPTSTAAVTNLRRDQFFVYFFFCLCGRVEKIQLSGESTVKKHLQDKAPVGKPASIP